MKKFKRLMALVAVGMLAMQLVGVQTAGAASKRNNGGTTSECDAGSDNLEVTIGDDDAAIRLNEDGILECDASFNGTFAGETGESIAATAVDSITVEMDDETNEGYFYIVLDDNAATHPNAAQWPTFDTFDINITTRLVFDGAEVDDAAGNKLRVTVGKDTFGFSGTSGTYVASSLQFDDGEDDDIFDASKATVRVYVNSDGANKGEDVYKGGSADDRIDSSTNTEDTIIYGNAGNDLIKTGTGEDQGWGGDGADTIDLGSEGASEYDTAAPGAGDDDVTEAEVVSYADLKDGIEWVNGLSLSTDGAAGDDEFTSLTLAVLVGSLGDDVIVDKDAGEIYGLGGDDAIKTAKAGDQYVEGGAGDDLIVDIATSAQESAFYGQEGNDVLRGKGDPDKLVGGPGKDQAWGGQSMEDVCKAEVVNRCEYGRI